MRLPIIRGLIRRRLLINYRVEAKVARRLVPAPFRLKLHGGYGIASICLIRLEQIRPVFIPRFFGLSSENAAHRIAVVWEEPWQAGRWSVHSAPRHEFAAESLHRRALLSGRTKLGELRRD